MRFGLITKNDWDAYWGRFGGAPAPARGAGRRARAHSGSRADRRAHRSAVGRAHRSQASRIRDAQRCRDTVRNASASQCHFGLPLFVFFSFMPFWFPGGAWRAFSLDIRGDIGVRGLVNLAGRAGVSSVVGARSGRARYSDPRFVALLGAEGPKMRLGVLCFCAEHVWPRGYRLTSPGRCGEALGQ